MELNKVHLENLICRAALRWERAHAEASAGNISDGVRTGDDELAKAVRAYRAYLIEESLPVKEPDDDDE